MLEAANIWLSLGGNPILKGAALTLAPGELTAVIGPNGAGKSTLLHVLSGALRPDRGTVTLDGAALSAHRRLELARRRAVLAQSPLLGFPFTALDVVMLGRSPHVGLVKPHDNRRIAEATMRETGIAGLSRRLYTTLSGGERQRVQLARALAQIWPDEAEATSGRDAARYLMLDEPTNNLDLAHQHGILETARRLADRGLGVLAILHDPNHAARYADRVCLMVGGRVVAAGAAADVLTEDRLGAIFGLKLRMLRDPVHDRSYMLPA